MQAITPHNLPPTKTKVNHKSQLHLINPPAPHVPQFLHHRLHQAIIPRKLKQNNPIKIHLANKNFPPLLTLNPNHLLLTNPPLPRHRHRQQQHNRMVLVPLIPLLLNDNPPTQHLVKPHSQTTQNPLPRLQITNQIQKTPHKKNNLNSQKQHPRHRQPRPSALVHPV